MSSNLAISSLAEYGRGTLTSAVKEEANADGTRCKACAEEGMYLEVVVLDCFH
jgi:hypothetical protein